MSLDTVGLTGRLRSLLASGLCTHVRAHDRPALYDFARFGAHGRYYSGLGGPVQSH